MELQLIQFRKGQGWSEEPKAILDSENTLLLFFGSPNIEDVRSALHEFLPHFPRSIFLGCSSAGEIFDDGLYDESLSLAIIKFERSRLSVSCHMVEGPENSEQIGTEIARDLDGDDLAAVFVLSDGLLVNGSRLVSGLYDALPNSDVVVTGGLAGDGDRFQKTWVWHGGAVRHSSVCALGLYGEDVHVGHGSRGGWDVLGPEREVTRSEANVLYTLDGQPALSLYKKYLGERAEGLPATGLLFPLAISNDNSDEDDTVRTILAVNEDDQSIVFAGDIPEGAYVRLMRANFDRLIDGATDASAMVETAGDCMGPCLNIAISCVGRRLVLSQRTEEEIEAVIEGLPPGTRQIGFYSYGEISPLASGRCDLHNQTMTLTLIWER
ncbi:MAG: FIST signal transduction protein [bacterium]